MGNIFQIANDAELFAIDVAFRSLTGTVGTPVAATLRALDADFTVIATTEEHELVATDLNGPTGTTFVHLVFADPQLLTAGEAYLVCVEHYGGIALRTGANGTSVAQTSFIYFDPPGAQTLDWYYTTTSPGGVSGSPDAPAEAVIDLAPGNWIVSANGLSSPPQALTVTGNLDAYLPTPAANAAITFRDYSIELTDGQLLTGQNIIMLANEGKLPHFMIGFKGPDGLTREQLGAILDAEMTGTPVASGPTGGAIDYSISFQSIDQSAGTTQWIAVTLEAGTCAAMCWVPEPGTGVPHAFMGMYNVFIVG